MLLALEIKIKDGRIKTMMRIIFCLILIAGCSSKDIVENEDIVENDFEKKYIVVSTFNETVLETKDKSEAYETAHQLTLMGRIFLSKPCYFVLEKGVEK